MRTLASFILTFVLCSPLSANQEKFQAAMQNSSKVICNAIFDKYVSLNSKKDAAKKMAPHKTELTDSCGAIKLERDKKCHGTFMVQFAEMTKGKPMTEALKVQAKKELVPTLEKCLMDNGKKLMADVNIVNQLYHSGKIEEGRKKPRQGKPNFQD